MVLHCTDIRYSRYALSDPLNLWQTEARETRKRKRAEEAGLLLEGAETRRVDP